MIRLYMPEYSSWRGMKSRCYQPKCASYERYGGSGISVCDRWINSFENFLNDMGYKPTPKHTIERINNRLGYSPDNCRWATRTEQVIGRDIFKNNKSGFTGVSKDRKKWRAYITVNKNKIMLGSFNTAEEAAIIRTEAVKKYFL